MKWTVKMSGLRKTEKILIRKITKMKKMKRLMKSRRSRKRASLYQMAIYPFVNTTSVKTRKMKARSSKKSKRDVNASKTKMI